MSKTDKHLTPILVKASNEELEPLVEYILKATASETLSIDPTYKQQQPNHKMYVSAIEHEIRTFGGNTMANMFRGTGPSYYEIAWDVAKKVGAKIEKGDSIVEIEMGILLSIMGKAWETMSEEDRLRFLEEANLGDDLKAGKSIPKALPILAIQTAIKLSGFFAYRFAALVSNALAKAILGRGLAFGANIALMRGIAVIAGPIGWALTGIWTVWDIAGPAFRVTLPCVVHIAMLRLQYSQKSGG